MGTLASVNIKFFADLKQFSSQMQNSERQIKKFGRSMKKVGSNLTMAVTAPILALGGAAVLAWDKQAKAIAQVEQGLKTTGNAVGYTSSELQKLASDLQDNSLFGDEEILKGATSQLLTFTNIAGKQFERTQQAALDLATRLDGDLKSASIQLGKALNDPVANLSALSRSGIQFSEDQKKTINALVKTNKLAEAQTIILDELEKQYGGSAAAAAKAGTGPLKQLSNSIGDLTEDFGKIISEALIPFADYVKKLVTRFKNLDDGTKRTIAKMGLLLAAVGPLLVSIGFLATNVMPGLILAFGALKVAMLSNPWLLLGAAVISVIALFGDFGSSVDDVKQKYDVLNDVRETAVKSIAAEKAKLSELLSIARDENLSKGIRLKAIKDLNK
ncbi:MAG TPA: hypothetical protein EYG85_00290, partial [Crocinitomix sp.]|nr:hypothetical protein [Crocinitomix sp.]